VTTNWPFISSPAKMPQVSIFVDVLGFAIFKNSAMASIGQITVRMPGTGWKLLLGGGRSA